MTRTGPVVPQLVGMRAVNPTSGVEQVMLLILALTIASTCLLTSSGHGAEEGHIPWGRNSILHVITDLTNLTHQFATARGTEVKWLTQACGASAALVCAAAAWFLRTRREFETEAALPEPASAKPFAWLTGMSPSMAAQVALVLFVGWTALSAFWSPWPEASVYEAMRFGIAALLAIAIGHCLSIRAARHGALILAGMLVLTALIAIWYHYERNPVQRLKYPIGNPIFFAACLLPAFPILGAWIVAEVLESRHAGKTDSQAVRRYLRIGAAAIGLLVLGWAFVLADSRGPGLGMALGLLCATLLITTGRTRLMLLAGTGVITIMFASLKLWPVSWLLSRPDTVRLRLYAWKYALNLFFTRPDIGRGQGAYVLLAQQPSRVDAARDPLAFPADLIGHAHNEWLEILADVGAFGLALMLTAIGVTLWSAVLAWRRMPGTRERCALFGVLAGFLGIIFESASDVALRMPGLPAIFYATWGLVWAKSRSASTQANGTRARPVRMAGLIATIAGAWLVMIVATRDWQAALAEPTAIKFASELQWDKSLLATDEAARHRLGIEPRLSALYRASRISRDAAAYRTQQLLDMVQRASQRRPPGDNDPEGIKRELAPRMRLAHEDVEAFEKYFEIGVNVGNSLLRYCPAYPHVASFISDLWLLRAQLTAIQEQTGPLPLQPVNTDPLEQARLWLLREFQGNRLSPELGLQLLRLSESRPMIERLDTLRIPMRSGPIHPNVEPALMELMQSQDFGPAMEALLAAARPAAGGQTPWPDAYSPETLRLAAIAHKVTGGFEQAAALSGQAAQLLDQIRDRFPTSAAYAMSDQAEYLLLSDPDRPRRAVAAMHKALELWPGRSRLQERQAIERTLVMYLLAAGAEADARRLLAALLGSAASEANVAQNTGMAYARLCQRFMSFPPDQRPAQFKEWLQQALLQAPRQIEPLLVAATVTLEEGQDEAAVHNLQALEELIQNPDQLASILRSLLSRFPSAPALQAFAAPRLPEFVQATQPAATRPSTATAPDPPTTREQDFLFR